MTDQQPHLSRASARPSAREDNRHLDELTGLERVGMRELRLEPGATVTVRNADQAREVFVYLLGGRGVLVAPAERTECSAGDFIALADDGTACRLENSGAEPLSCLVGSR